MNLYLTKPGRLKRKDNTLQFIIFESAENQFTTDDETPLDEDAATVTKRNLPVEVVDAVYLFNEVRLNTKLLNFMAQKRIPVHFFNYWGHHTGTFMPHAAQYSGDLVIEQGLAFKDIDRRMTICRAITESKLHNQLSVLQYYGRRKKSLDEVINAVKEIKSAAVSAETPEQLMGFEGLAGRKYYSVWHIWLSEIEKDFTRQYRPPDNPVNALISFFNSLLYTACVSELYRTALYPGISYIHAPQSRRFSLALDLVEPFKPLMVDRLIFRLFSRGDISGNDFQTHGNGTLLTDKGRQKILKAWDEQLRTTVSYPALKRSVSYRQLLRLDCYKLIKHLLENREYKPYQISY
jgi:CRISPR-associated protein Cas1